MAGVNKLEIKNNGHEEIKKNAFEFKALRSLQPDLQGKANQSSKIKEITEIRNEIYENITKKETSQEFKRIQYSNLPKVTITDPNAFVAIWNTSLTSYYSSASNQIALPLISSGTYSFQVDWGDGTVDTITDWAQAEKIHTYATPGVYTITITGTLKGWSFYYANPNDATKIIVLQQWGNMSLGNSGRQFYEASNLIVNATDAPDLSETTMLHYMFGYAYVGDQGSFDHWNVSGVTNMAGMFFNSKGFNKSIGNWDVSSVTTMETMFQGAKIFNQPIGNWNVSSVTTMQGMFANAVAFNQPIGDWDVSSVTRMDHMFDLATKFNQPIGNWNVSSVTNMVAMFAGAVSFNQSIGNWDVSSVFGMYQTFAGAKSFNQYIGDWNVSSVIDMGNMFAYASSFNQPLENWDVSSVTKMDGIFFKASKFDQPLGNWNVTSVVDMNFALDYAGFSIYNYEATLIGWSKQNLQQKVLLGANGLKYTSYAQDERQYIIDTFNWTITGDMLVNGTPYAPLNLTATLSGSDIVLYWDTPLSDGGLSILNYSVYRANDINGPFSWIANTTTLTFTDYNVPIGGTLYYAVTASNELGESQFSNIAWVNVSIIALPPQSLNATLDGNTKVSLAWLPPATSSIVPVFEYRIYRENKTGILEYLGNTTDTVYTDDNVMQGMEYTYFVTAVTIQGESGFSNPAYIYIPYMNTTNPNNTTSTVTQTVTVYLNTTLTVSTCNTTCNVTGNNGTTTQTVTQTVTNPTPTIGFILLFSSLGCLIILKRKKL